MPPTILLLDEGGALHGALRAASGQDGLQGQWLVAASVEIAQSLLEQHAVDAVVLPWALREAEAGRAAEELAGPLRWEAVVRLSPALRQAN